MPILIKVVLQYNERLHAYALGLASRDGSKGGGAHPPKIFQNAATRGSGGGGGRWWGVNCVIVTIECIVILGILIFYLSIQTLNHDIYFSDFDSQ